MSKSVIRTIKLPELEKARKLCFLTPISQALYLGFFPDLVTPPDVQLLMEVDKDSRRKQYKYIKQQFYCIIHMKKVKEVGEVHRNLLSALIEWKQKPDRKPLVLKGVRQCGKTYLLKDFGARFYEDIAYFNFEAHERLHSLFDNDLDVSRILLELGIFRNKAIQPGTTLIIFDEIQFCSRALTSLKYFCENAPEYSIVAAGSLLGMALAKPSSFPVGKVDFLTLRPMSFCEFLLANDEEMLCDYLVNSGNGKIPEIFHDKLINYLKAYCIVGGMPEAVDIWVRIKDIAKVEEIQKKIIESYELDFAKHAPAKDFPKLSAIWRSIPEQLAKENSKFIFSQVRKGWRAKDLEDALEWLLSAGLAYKVAKIEKPFIPLSAYADQTFFKLYMADVGLLRKMSNLPAMAILDKSDTFKEFKGALIENYVLCELINAQDTVPFYWKSGNTAEVDFVVQHGMDIVPIEVKADKNTKAKSLAQYRKKYEPRVSVRTSMNPLSGKEIKDIPLYLIWKIAQYIED